MDSIAQERLGAAPVSTVSPTPESRPEFPAVSEATISELVQEINRTGYAVLPEFVKSPELLKLQTFIQTTVDNNGGQYLALPKDDMTGSLLEVIAADPNFLNLIHRVYELGTGETAPKQSLYQVCRCLAGDTGIKQSLIFHYDSYVVTILLPLMIPNKGKQGHLVMAPNLRKIHKSYLLNLVEKILVDNPVTQWTLRALFNAGIWKLTTVKMTPGNLYLFWGYRSFHANEACDPENIRSTALFHFGDPHADSGLRRRMGKVKV